MTKRIAVVLCLLLVSAACTKQSATNNSESPMHKITVGSAELNVEIADTQASREKGLSNRDHLPEDQGMLFDFTNTNINRPSFWMKETRFNLDLLWIKNNVVIAVTEDVPAPKNPDEILPSYPAPDPVDTVVEVNSGWVKRHNITVGDKITR